LGGPDLPFLQAPFKWGVPMGFESNHESKPVDTHRQGSTIHTWASPVEFRTTLDGRLRLLLPDWDAFAELLADDVMYEGPQTRERVRGAGNYVRLNVEGFPGEWHLRVVRIVGEDRHAASWIDFTNADGTTQPGLCFFELNDEGKIVRITDFWPDPYELPTKRAHLVERY
jgi:hypothetical protein